LLKYVCVITQFEKKLIYNSVVVSDLWVYNSKNNVLYYNDPNIIVQIDNGRYI